MVIKLLESPKLKDHQMRAIDLSLVYLILGQNFRILFYVLQNDDLHKKVIGSLLLTQNWIFLPVRAT